MFYTIHDTQETFMILILKKQADFLINLYTLGIFHFETILDNIRIKFISHTYVHYAHTVCVLQIYFFFIIEKHTHVKLSYVILFNSMNSFPSLH